MKIPELTEEQIALIGEWGAEAYHEKVADLSRARDAALAKLHEDFGATHVAKLTGWSRHLVVTAVARARCEHVPLSTKALADLQAGLESARTQPVVIRAESFAQYANTKLY